MADFEIPEKLVLGLKQRTVIPFIGAGFSASLGLPGWDDLLKFIAKDLRHSIPFEEVRSFCGNDFMQMAEYFFLKCDSKIGPIRHSISKAIQRDIQPVLSGMHVELVNLGQQQIYTTNYDDLIEKTFDILNIPNRTIVIPKDIALSDYHSTQIIKYHGDLNHEETLVITESKYYTRLEFESPLDLKFRSDILGKSVLFMGYSLRDINIRIIWYKLNKMMEEIPLGDRPNSFIIRFGSNPPLDKLYDSVGIKSIVLDPDGKCKSSQERSQLLSQFMFELTRKVCTSNLIPGTDKPMFVSMSIIDQLENTIASFKSERSERNLPNIGRYNQFEILFQHLGIRVIPKEPQEIICRLEKCLEYWSLIIGKLNALTSCAFLENYISQFGYTNFTTNGIFHLLLHSERTRNILLANESLSWSKIYSMNLTDVQIKQFLARAEREVNHHENWSPDEPPLDHDIAYVLDILFHIKLSEEEKPESEYLEKIDALIDRICQMYDSALRYQPSDGEKPSVFDVERQITNRSGHGHFGDEPPF